MMKNLSFAPAKRTAAVSTIDDVFRTEKSSEEWVKTSVNMRPDMRIRVKIYAVEHGMKIQDVVDAALSDYLTVGGDSQ